jgi:GT2 family glycosyltransferase/glycosyltransferase involved in cell wall biosynthesis
VSLNTTPDDKLIIDKLDTPQEMLLHLWLPDVKLGFEGRYVQVDLAASSSLVGIISIQRSGTNDQISSSSYRLRFAQDGGLVQELKLLRGIDISPDCAITLQLSRSAGTVEIRRVSLSSAAILTESTTYKEAVARLPSEKWYNIEARLETASADLIRGWAVIRERPDETASVDVKINGQTFTRLQASDPRSDLRRKGLSTGRGGFSIKLPVAPTTDSRQLVSIAHPATATIFPTEIAIDDLPQRIDRRTDCSRSLSALRNYRPRVTVIVPVFNAVTHLRRCVYSLAKHTPAHVRVLFIDDHSTDPRIAELFSIIERIPGFYVLSNSSNMGFTRTVNRGIDEAGEDDVVLLNSDTEVGPRWLSRLLWCAYSEAFIGSVTPLSDNAGIFSVPEKGENNLSHVSTDDLCRTVANVSAFLRPDVPTGNGFCLFIKRQALKAVGMLDNARFPRGYGEENDWCRRAGLAGWTHVIDDSTFVRHARSASFGNEKNDLYAQGRQALDEAYPDYTELVRALDARVDLISIRSRVRHRIWHMSRSAQKPRPRILFVISKETGGTPQTNLDLMREISPQYEPFLLRCEKSSLSLRKLSNDGSLDVVEEHTLREPLDLYSLRNSEYDEIVCHWVHSYSVEIAHIRHIAWHSLGLFDLLNTLEVPIVFSLHDFFVACPTVKLVDGAGKFCGGDCERGSGACKPDLWQITETPALRGKWVRTFRGLMSYAIQRSDALVTTSDYAADTLRSLQPMLSMKDFRVIPHGRTFERFMHCSLSFNPTEPLKVLVPGNINKAKGSEIIRALAADAKQGNTEFHVLGAVDASLRDSNVILHGTYDRDSFQSLVERIKPHIGMILSIWPETYCHTLTEMWACGLPVLGFDIGAVGERIRTTGGGWLLPVSDAPEVGALLEKIRGNPEMVTSVRRNVETWQAEEGTTYNASQMASHYLQLYGDLTSSPKYSRRRYIG